LPNQRNWRNSRELLGRGRRGLSRLLHFEFESRLGFCSSYCRWWTTLLLPLPAVREFI
jgi:hypothetical protein